MIGFVRSDKEVRTLGGEVIRLKKRRMRIFLIITMLMGFALVNVVLYLLTAI
jgi:phage shock protein PspC (stress-responsive transcriptional regulator)